MAAASVSLGLLPGLSATVLPSPSIGLSSLSLLHLVVGLANRHSGADVAAHAPVAGGLQMPNSARC
eukprot:6030598-Alexandrium_andersonii.AAC.1